MISRTKVNYSLEQLIKAFFITERGKDYKSYMISMLNEYTGESNILLTPSGRGGLYYILKAIDKPRALIPAYTCKAVVEAAIMADKTVTYIEIEEDGFNISISALEESLDEQSILVLTHQFGFPCSRMDEILGICRSKKVYVIEDAAGSFGSRINGKLTGTFGDAAFYSFDSTKLINVPMKGGFVTIKDPIIFERIKDLLVKETKAMPLLRKVSLLAQAFALIIIENHLLYKIFHKLMFELKGRFTTDSPDLDLELNQYYIFAMANWQAFIAATQVVQIGKIIGLRRSLYSKYLERLSECRAFKLPPKDAASEWACIRFPIRIKGNKFDYYNKAIKKGVDFAFSFTFIACPESYRNARLLADSVLDIPYYLKISDRELSRVVSALKSIDEEFCDEYR